MTAAHERLEFGETGRAFYDFFWSQYADWYIESAKTRLYGADADAAATTRAVRCPTLPPPFQGTVNQVDLEILVNVHTASCSHSKTFP